MNGIIIDENGATIDFLEERNKCIKENLTTILDEFLAEKQENRLLKKTVSLGYRFSKQLYSVLASYPRMTAQEFTSLNYDQVNDYWLKYLDLTAYYNRFFEIVDNKQLLMAFMGINSRQYKELENHEDEDIRGLMGMINNAFVGLGFIATESGNSSPTATMGRLQARGEGHGVVKESDGQIIDNLAKRTPQETMRELQNLIGGRNLIGGKK